MATRIKEGMIPYTGGDGIEITDNHVINVLLRAANNLIHVNEDRELYVDLQLPAGIAPDDEFPVGVTTGEILAEDGWEQSGTIINSKTTSGDYVRLIYANDGNLYYDPGTGVWIMIGTATQIDVNTKTFFLPDVLYINNDQNNPTQETITVMEDALAWYESGKNPLIMWKDYCYILTGFQDGTPEASMYEFSSAMSQHPKRKIMDVAVFEGEILGIYTYTSNNYSGNTQTFYVSPGDTQYSRYNAGKALALYLTRDSNSATTNNIPSPRLLTTDALGSGPHIYELVNASSSQLIFVSQVLTDEAPNDFYVSQVTLNYSGSTVTSIARNDYKVNKTYTAGSGISIDANNVISANIQGALVYKGNIADVASLPSSGNTVGDVYYVEDDGLMYAWDGTAWKAVGNTQIDLSNYFNVTTNTTDDITQGTTNLFVTQAMIDAWNGKQGALTAGSNIQINNGVISATDTTYSAGTGIAIDQNNQISNSLPFNPENAGSVGQVLKRTSTGVRWSNSMTASGASFGAFITECKNNGTKHVTTISKRSSYSEDDLGSQSYTMQGNGYFNVRIYSTRGSVASVAINGEVIIERTSSDGQGTYEVDQINLITVSQGDVVTVSLNKYAGLALATIYDYY